MKNLVRCRNCWWFRYLHGHMDTKGYCLMYGLKVQPDDVICCDFDRGD